MDELVDILDQDGNPTGRTALKSEAHRKGWFHPTVHVWCYTVNGKILIQQRAAEKDTHPLLWDVSVAGHICAGESPEAGAIREVSEEIGLDIRERDLQKVAVFKAVHEHSPELMDCEFHHVFICELRQPLAKLKRQQDEVAALELIPMIKFSEETWGLGNLTKYVPHGPEYYKEVITAIRRKLG